MSIQNANEDCQILADVQKLNVIQQSIEVELEMQVQESQEKLVELEQEIKNKNLHLIKAKTEL